MAATCAAAQWPTGRPPAAEAGAEGGSPGGLKKGRREGGRALVPRKIEPGAGTTLGRPDGRCPGSCGSRKSRPVTQSRRAIILNAPATEYHQAAAGQRARAARDPGAEERARPRLEGLPTFSGPIKKSRPAVADVLESVAPRVAGCQGPAARVTCAESALEPAADASRTRRPSLSLTQSPVSRSTLHAWRHAPARVGDDETIATRRRHAGNVYLRPREGSPPQCAFLRTSLHSANRHLALT